METDEEQSLGIDDLIHFDFMDPPPAETLIRALVRCVATLVLFLCFQRAQCVRISL